MKHRRIEYLHRFRSHFAISNVGFIGFSLVFFYIFGQHIQFAVSAATSLPYRIYSHWIKSLFLLAINKYHSINAYNESNETTQPLPWAFHLRIVFVRNIVSLLLLGTFHFFICFSFCFVCASAYDGLFSVLVFSIRIHFELSHEINELNTLNFSAIWMKLGTHIVRPSILFYSLVCHSFSIWRIFFIPTILNIHLEATTRFRFIYNVANNTLIGFHSDIVFACSLFANKRKHM